MTRLPRFESSESATAEMQASTEPSIPSASWSGYPATNDDPLIGQTLNEAYVVESVIGEGGMGRVYRARHTRISNKRFAIKVLRPEYTSNAEVVARFRREAEAAACISHPNVVEVYDVDITRDGYTYLVCEYLAGIDLADYLAQIQRLEPLRAVNMAIQVCHALEEAHASGVIHRDVKPHNIFLIGDNKKGLAEYPALKVLDFGLSRFTDSEGTTQLTRAGVIMGTPAYMSPEQAEGKPVDARTDIYGLGAVLFAALAGRPPYEAEGLQALVMAVISGSPDRLRAVCPSVPESLEFIVEHAMARNANERYQSMQEFRAALEGFFTKASNHSVPPPSPIRLPTASFMVEPDDLEIAQARPKLVAYGAVLTLLIAFGIASSVSSIELFTGRLKLSRVESLLLFFGLTGTLATPSSLLLLKVKKTVWTSHKKVLNLLSQLRRATLSTLVAYGSLILGLLVADDVVGRMTETRLLGHSLGAGFRGYNVVYFVIACLWAALSLYLFTPAQKLRGRLLKVGVVAVAMAASLGLVFGALVLRYKVVAASEAATAAHRSQLVAEMVAQATPSVPKAVITAPVEPPTKKAPAKRASDDELAAAVVRGTQGLLPLSERYPEDPNVLRPLVTAFASRATGLADAMAVAGRLLAIAPEDSSDQDLRFLVRKAATSPGEASRLAFELMTARMGSAGADLLYELSLSDTRVAKQAEVLLDTPRVKAHFSPALSIAYDLRKAKTCAARLPMLERASGLGDRRSVNILSPLAANSKRGCGRWKRSPCPALCNDEARAYLDAITKILERQPMGR